jgi:CHAD domain-containing protein
MAKAKQIRIRCNAPASVGIKLVLMTRFEELLSWREKTLDWTDPEGVHSMRVASRRLRSALRDFTPHVRKRRLAPVLKRLKNLADTLGSVRDHDVAILGLEEMQKQAPRHSSAALKELIEARVAVREQARQELAAIIESEKLQELETEFVACIDEATSLSERKSKQHADEPEATFAEMSRSIILGRLKEFEKLTNALFKPLDAEPLHDLRIAVKRLRYALELFQRCWGRSMGTHAKRAARMQTALGDIHDCDVWIASVGKQIVRARKQNEAERVRGLVALLEHFTKLRNKHLRRALARWNEWEAHDSSGKIRAALAPKEEAVEIPEMPAVVEAEATATQVAGEQMRQGL